jgi:hypothetical protein
MSMPLHPNLARIGAAYDQVQARAASGEISATQARAEIMHLVARDDEGVLWSIDPSSGNWMRRTIAGELVFDTPPTYGVATPTAHDLTRSPTGAFNPDSNLIFHEVDEVALLGERSLRGATRRPVATSAGSRSAWHLPVPALAAAAVVALVALAVVLLR